MTTPSLMQTYPLLTGSSTPILRTPAQQVKSITAEVRKFCDHLLELMWLYE